MVASDGSESENDDESYNEGIEAVVLLKIGILENFTNFTGKQLCWTFFVTKLQALRHIFFKA